MQEVNNPVRFCEQCNTEHSIPEGAECLKVATVYERLRELEAEVERIKAFLVL